MEARDYWHSPEAAARFVREITSVEGQFDLLRATEYLRFSSVLDVGFGRGGASVYFAMTGKETTALDLEERVIRYPPDVFNEDFPALLMDALGVRRIASDFHDLAEVRMYDAIWMSHVLEHTLDAGRMLRKAARLLSPNGWLMLMVPPYKPQVVMGHLSTGWNVGQLIHALLVAGFNVRYGHFVRHGYNICAFVQKGNELTRTLAADASDDTRSIASFLEPWVSTMWPMPVEQGFQGDLDQVNWFGDFSAFLRTEPLPLRRMYYPAEAFQSNRALLKDGRWQHTASISHDHFVYGPYAMLPDGPWEVTWDLRPDGESVKSYPVAVDVAVNSVGVVARRAARDEQPTVRFQHHGGGAVEFRIYADGMLTPGAVSFGGVLAVRKQAPHDSF